MTAITITDPTLLEQLRRVDATELRDPDGQVLGEFAPRRRSRPAGMTRADVREFREQMEVAMRKAEAEPIDEARDFKPPPGYKLPFTDEQIAEFRRHKTGRPLLESLRELEELP